MWQASTYLWPVLQMSKLDAKSQDTSSNIDSRNVGSAAGSLMAIAYDMTQREHCMAPWMQPSMWPSRLSIVEQEDVL